MSAADIVKEAMRMLYTAGITKDVVELLEKKLTLITDENTSLQQRLDEVLSENVILKQENIGLKKTEETEPLHEDALRILGFLAESPGEATVSGIVAHTGMEVGKVNFRLDQLRLKAFIAPVIRLSDTVRVRILPAGRAFHFSRK